MRETDLLPWGVETPDTTRFLGDTGVGVVGPRLLDHETAIYRHDMAGHEGRCI